MARTIYALPVDVLRRFDPTLDQATLDNNRLFDNEDEETILARIEASERKFDDRTGHPFRERRVGTPGEPFTYEMHSADFRRYQGGVAVFLEHDGPVLPFDSTEGDTLEIRTGRDNWKDITDDEGSMYEADWMDAVITIYGSRYAGAWRNAAVNNNVRFTYRVGSFGSDPDEGGQTKLDSDPTGDGTDTQLDVADARRLPPRGIVNLGGVEYAMITDRDLTNDQITVTRGVRHTDETSSELSSGDIVHYCPENVRDAVAAKAARDLIKVDHIGDNLPTPEDDFTFNDWLTDLDREWSEAIAENAEAKML